MTNAISQAAGVSPGATGRITAASVAVQPASVTITWSDGVTGEFAAIWLRDNQPEDRDRHSGQRLIDVMDVPAEPRIRSAVIAGGDLRLQWLDEPHTPVYALDLLRDHATGARGRPELDLRCWPGAAELAPQRDFGWLALDVLRSDAGARLAWLTRLLQDGLAFLSDVPCVDNAILDAMALVGRVPETNYGFVFDVRAVPQPENLAYSDLGLGLHTDNPYREPVPGFQALHTLLAAPDGGDSLFADGYALAAHLRATEPDAFLTLTRTPVPFWYRGTGADLYAERPLIELSCSGEIAAVSYNNRSIRPVRLPAAQCVRFYAAYRRFAALLREPRFQLRTHLENGQLVVFDNRRVLHGRTGFVSAKHPRHLQGCYLTRDSVLSQTAQLRSSRESRRSA